MVIDRAGEAHVLSQQITAKDERGRKQFRAAHIKKNAIGLSA